MLFAYFVLQAQLSFASGYARGQRQNFWSQLFRVSPLDSRTMIA